MKNCNTNFSNSDLLQACGHQCCSLSRVAILQYWSTTVCIQLALTDENWMFKTTLGYHLGYLSVIVSSLFFKRGSHAIATTVLRNIHLPKIFSRY